MDLSNKIKAAAEYIKGKSKYNPTIGLILGSGLGAIADQIEDAEYFPYNEIPNFPVSTVEGHARKIPLLRRLLNARSYLPSKSNEIIRS